MSSTTGEPVKYAIVVERAEGNYSAFVLDVPGCIATGATVEEVKQRLGEALADHLALLSEDGDPVPEPTTLVDYVDVEIAIPSTKAG